MENILFNYSTKVAIASYTRNTNTLGSKTSGLEQKSIDFTRRIFRFLELANRSIDNKLVVFNSIAKNLEESIIPRDKAILSKDFSRSIEELIEDITIMSSSRLKSPIIRYK